MFVQETLLEQIGNGFTNKVKDRLYQFAYMPPQKIEQLKREALTEEWGSELFALIKYLAVYIPWSIEQNCYTFSHNQLYVTAGNLKTRYGTPIYLVFEENNSGSQPWSLKVVGSNIRAPEFPTPPQIPEPPSIPKGEEIVIMHDHVLGENSERIPFLSNTPIVAQMCAVSGAIQWSLYRGLERPYWYWGKMQYLVPLYLENRENIALAPDGVAALQVSSRGLLVRTVLEPHMPYANARVAVDRHDQLPPWLLDSWNSYAKSATVQQLEGTEENLL